ncbi:MAG: amidohydrolase family protein, partial [Deltaproteobacteria bacterium]|nr:amidohydrolase family protein [Deltaproteobacteria bacterium]
GMSPDNVELLLAHPLVLIGSDGASMAPVAGNSGIHPRSFGTFPRVLSEYVRTRNIIDLPHAIRKMTSMPADRMGLADRGRIARGMKADIVVFNAETVQDKATFETPTDYPTGIEHVMVNGRWVLEFGKHTGKTPGTVLRKQSG